MRLIDADALEKKFKTYKELFLDGWGGFSSLPPKDKARVDELDNCIAQVINAPTVEAVAIPCKVGDEVWCVRDARVYNKPVKGTVTEIYFRDKMDMCIVVRCLCRGRWGERVFATEQEAQAAIDRRVNDGNL